MNQGLSCPKLAKLAGVSVRTLHYYDRIGLLRPSIRTEARYRLYGEAELLRLQQILLYKELDFTLPEIRSILDDPDFDLLAALRSQKRALQARRDRLSVLLNTLDDTISQLNGKRAMLTNEELYAGFPKGQGEEYRRQAAAKYGAAVVEESEQKLRRLGPESFAALRAESADIDRCLRELQGQDPASPAVQSQVARHYASIRQYWGEAVCRSKNMDEAYKGLAQLYLDDPRYTAHNGEPSPEYAAFLAQAMRHYADKQL